MKVYDVVTINSPLHPETEDLFDEKLIAKMKRGADLVNAARGKNCGRDGGVRARSGRYGQGLEEAAEFKTCAGAGECRLFF